MSWRKSDGLYNRALATYDRGDQFERNTALGFIKLWGLPLSTQAQTQLLHSEGSLLSGMQVKYSG